MLNAVDDIEAIFKRIATGTHTESDLAVLRRALLVNKEQNLFQIGKYNVRIDHGEDVHIGDHIYQGPSAQFIQDALRQVLQEREYPDELVDFLRRRGLTPEAPGSRLVHKYLGHTSNVNPLSVSADDSLLASGSDDWNAIVWNVVTGEVVARFRHESWVCGVALHPQGQQLVTLDGRGTLRLWNITSRALLAQQSAHHGSSRALALGPDGRVVASGGTDTKIHLWLLPELQPILTLEGHISEVRRVAFNPDGTRLASAGMDGTLRLWFLADPTQRCLLERPNTPIRSVAYSPDGSAIAAVDGDGVVWLWDVENSVARWHVQGHEGPATGIGFHPNGRLLASGGQDGLIQLWDAGDGRLLETITGHEKHVISIVFAHNGRWMFSSSWDKTVRLWRI